MAKQLPIDFTDNGSIIITHLVVDTGYACDPDPSPGGGPPTTCDCDAFTDQAQNYGAAQAYTYDDLIRSPADPGFEYFAQAYPTHTITATLIDYSKEISELVHQNNKFNCEIQQKGGNPSANNLIITEILYEQPQLFGFPIISNPYTDPLPLYTHTTMRLIKASRGGSSGSDPEIVGPACEAYPFIVRDINVDYYSDPSSYLNQEVDILDGAGPSDFGFLSWNPNPSSNSSEYLEDELITSRMALNDFTNAKDANDHELSVGDWVASLSGVNASVLANSEGILATLEKKKIRIPVWGNFDRIGPRDIYEIVGFAWVRIESVPTTAQMSSNKEIKATYLGPANEGCN
jgi:hypothetical protein